MRFPRALAVLLLFVLPPSLPHEGREREERIIYFETLAKVYESFGLDGKELAQRYVLTGLLSDAVNQGASPREERRIKDMELLSLEEVGSFQARLLTDSLAHSLEYYLVEGAVNFAEVSVAISNVEQLEPSLYVQRKRTRSPVAGGGRDAEGTVVNNGSTGIHELLDLADHTQCKKDILDECERGSVAIDTWTNQTLAFQRWLAQNLSLNLIQMLGTHNSFNNKADGYGTGDFTLGKILEFLSDGKWEFVWAQQWFTMTDQLQMGVRHLMLDPVYFWGKMRLCHCGTTFKWFDKVLDFIEKTLNITIQFDSADLGCMPYDRTLEAGLQEIYDWVVAPSNQEEVVMVYLNDETHSSDWGHIDLIQKPVQEIFGNLLFTPEDKRNLFPESWPSPYQLVKLGKRVVATCTSRCNDSYIFLEMHVPAWDRDTMKYFTAAPACGGFSAGQWYLVGGESQVVGPIYNGPKDEGLIIRENLPYVMQCPVSVPEMDIVSPSLIKAAVWTWLPGYSYDNVSTTHCAAVDSESEGRWKVELCSVALYHMCQMPSNLTEVVLSTVRAPWGQAGCPSGYTFSLPQTGYINWKLFNLMSTKYGNNTQAWINLPPNH